MCIAAYLAEGVTLSGARLRVRLQMDGVLEKLTYRECRRCKAFIAKSLRQKDRIVLTIHFLNGSMCQSYRRCIPTQRLLRYI